jgi:hypothetical protein
MFIASDGFDDMHHTCLSCNTHSSHVDGCLPKMQLFSNLRPLQDRLIAEWCMLPSKTGGINRVKVIPEMFFVIE